MEKDLPESAIVLALMNRGVGFPPKGEYIATELSPLPLQ